MIKVGIVTDGKVNNYSIQAQKANNVELSLTIGLLEIVKQELIEKYSQMNIKEK